MPSPSAYRGSRVVAVVAIIVVVAGIVIYVVIKKKKLTWETCLKNGNPRRHETYRSCTCREDPVTIRQLFPGVPPFFSGG